MYVCVLNGFLEATIANSLSLHSAVKDAFSAGQTPEFLWILHNRRILHSHLSRSLRHPPPSIPLCEH